MTFCMWQGGEAVHLAYRLGSNGDGFSYVLPVSCEEDTEEAASNALNDFCGQVFGGGGLVRLAPPVLNQKLGFRVGLVCVYKGNMMADEFFSRGGAGLLEEEAAAAEMAVETGGSVEGRAEDGEEEESGGGDDGGKAIEDGGDDVSRMTGDDGVFSSDDEEDEEDAFNVDEEAISVLTRRLEELEAERDKALAVNAKLQKLCSGILARIGRDAQPRGGVDAGEGTEAPQAGTSENTSEKESHLAETLQAIAEGRLKLVRQQGEYDQLALDLQTRLDDKEFKAEEISDSLNEFKRYRGVVMGGQDGWPVFNDCKELQ